jgi:hypothetical protein
MDKRREEGVGLDWEWDRRTLFLWSGSFYLLFIADLCDVVAPKLQIDQSKSYQGDVRIFRTALQFIFSIQSKPKAIGWVHWLLKIFSFCLASRALRHFATNTTTCALTGQNAIFLGLDHHCNLRVDHCGPLESEPKTVCTGRAIVFEFFALSRSEAA